MKLLIGLALGAVIGYGTACTVHYGFPDMEAVAFTGTNTMFCTVNGHTSRYVEGQDGVRSVSMGDLAIVEYNEGWPEQSLTFDNSACQTQTS